MKSLRKEHLSRGRALLDSPLAICLLFIMLPMISVTASVPWDEPLEGPRVIQEWLLAAVPDTGNAHVEGITDDHLEKLLEIEEAEFATVHHGPSVGDKLTGNPDFDWRVVRSEGILDIDAAIQPKVNNEHSTAYLFTYVTSPVEREMRMLVGSDDSISVWLNGINVHRKAVRRRIALDQDSFVVTLRKGKNALMLKVAEHTGDWAVVARFQYVSGLRFSIDKTKDGKALPPAGRYIRNWLILLLPNPPPGSAIQACRTDLIWKHDGKLTEESIAQAGVVEGDPVEDRKWVRTGLLDLGGNNINEMVNRSLGWAGDHNNVTLYAFCTVYSPDNRYTNMRIGSDDSVVVWFAGEEIWRYARLRGLIPDQDSIPVTLHKGQNYLLIKVSEQSGGWAMSVRFEDDEGLRFSTNRDFQPVNPIGKLLTTWGAIRKSE